MNWKVNKDRPVCPQICEKICLGISLGEYQIGDRLMSVRDVALLAGVNPNTVQKSFEQLEAAGILYSQRGSGWFVSEDKTKASEMIERLYDEKTREFFTQMSALGMNNEKIKEYVLKWNG